jgi:5-methylcytosine-specific restriction enzyme subunit McrC
VRKVGVAVLTGREVHIVPKTSLQNIVFMASMGGIQLRLAETEIAYGYDDAIPTAVAQAFITALQQTTRRGLLRGYQSVEDSASVVRGRWNITRQLAMSPGIPLPIEIDFDDYTEDIDENRILASALQVLARIEGLESVLTDSIGRFRVFFSEVQSLPRGVPLPNLRLNRLNQHYAVPLRLARVILEAVSWTHRDGAVVGGTFLVDMAAVFESYIANRLQSVLADHGLDVTAQDQHWWLDAERSVSLRPDIVISHGGTPLTVADTKYKVLGDGQGSIPNGDIYQAVAYALALNVRSAHLIYVSGDFVGRVVDIPAAGVRVHVHALPLRGTIEQVEASVAYLADRLSVGVAPSAR